VLFGRLSWREYERLVERSSKGAKGAFNLNCHAFQSLNFAQGTKEANLSSPDNECLFQVFLQNR
jgi:hypothetical protein